MNDFCFLDFPTNAKAKEVVGSLEFSQRLLTNLNSL